MICGLRVGKLRHKFFKWPLGSLTAEEVLRCEASQPQVCASPLTAGPAGRDEYERFCHPNSSTFCQLLHRHGSSDQQWWVAVAGACITFHQHWSRAATAGRAGCSGRDK